MLDGVSAAAAGWCLAAVGISARVAASGSAPLYCTSLSYIAGVLVSFVSVLLRFYFLVLLIKQNHFRYITVIYKRPYIILTPYPVIFTMIIILSHTILLSDITIFTHFAKEPLDLSSEYATTIDPHGAA